LGSSDGLCRLPGRAHRHLANLHASYRVEDRLNAQTFTCDAFTANKIRYRLYPLAI